MNNIYETINLKEAEELILKAGHEVTVCVQGPMGFGKSSLLYSLAEKLPEYTPVYLDATTLDVGDLCLPRVNGVYSEFVPNKLLGFSSDKPSIICIDELGKGNKAVINALLRFMLEKKMHHYEAHPDTIIFATTNLGSEGLGDIIPPHARNRIAVVKVRKATHEEWINDFALPRQLHPVVITCVREYPNWFEDFDTVPDPNSNPYIFHPKDMRPAFVTGRSLEKASRILYAMEHASDGLVAHALAGVLGKPAAMDMLTYKQLEADLPKWKDIIKAPLKTKLPKSGASMVMLVLKAAMTVTDKELGNWLQYVERMGKEQTALFLRTSMRLGKDRVQELSKMPAFVEKAKALHEIIA